MDKKLSRMLSSSSILSFVLLVVFAGITALFLKSYYVAIGEGVAIVAMFIFYTIRTRKRAKDIRKYVEDLAFQIDDASKLSIVNFPLPIAILRLDSGEVIWGNNLFSELSGKKEHLFEVHIKDIFPSFDTKWLMEGKQICPYDVELNGKNYNVYGNIVDSPSDNGRTLLATLFLVDITDYSGLRLKHDKSRPVVSIIVVDSYDELYKGLSESERSSLTASIDSVITGWAQPTGGIVRRLDRDRYLFIFEHQDYIDIAAGKFSVLDEMKKLTNSQGITATLSIGIGRGADASFGELYRYASMGIDMALSRGGDQVVIKTKNKYEFFGGKTKQVEKRTKVKARVTANALKQFINESDHIFIMGHKFSDLDCIGAAAGICSVVRACGKKPYIITDRVKSNAGELIDALMANPLYEGVFISESDAIVMANAQSLCIVVDTCRPDIVEAPELLQTVQRVALIDHHRRAADFIEDSDITLHETYASSASELVAELLQYIVAPRDILKIEAEAMLSGIVLDTKSFTLHTGVRTFEAAAYLKQLGADTLEVKRMFGGDMEMYVKKYSIISKAKEIAPGISLAVVNEQVERAVASMAADEMMGIARMKASIVVFQEGNGCAVSARSYGDVNVQVLMEKIGGGGSLNMAGAQFADKKPAEVAKMISAAVAAYNAELESGMQQRKEEDK